MCSAGLKFSVALCNQYGKTNVRLLYVLIINIHKVAALIYHLYLFVNYQFTEKNYGILFVNMPKSYAKYF